MHTIIVICSVCRKFIDIKDGKGVSGNSHGICQDCWEKVMDNLRESRIPFKGKKLSKRERKK